MNLHSKLLLFGMFVVAVLAADAALAGRNPIVPPPRPGYVPPPRPPFAGPPLHHRWDQVWNDEFDGTMVDPNNWVFRDSFATVNPWQTVNNELQGYDTNHASSSNGELAIVGERIGQTGSNYRSSRIESTFAQAFGRFDVRAKVPSGQGAFPAIFLYPGEGGDQDDFDLAGNLHPTNPNWPLGGEIDIVEFFDDPTKANGSYHNNEDPNASPLTSLLSTHAYQRHESSGQEEEKEEDWSTDFHLYTVEWEPTEIRYFVDGAEYYRLTDQDPVQNGSGQQFQRTISSTPMHIVLNLAIGGDPVTDPDPNAPFSTKQLDIDYVRVYQRNAFDSADSLLANVNGDFQNSLQDWTTTGNVIGNVSVQSHDEQFNNLNQQSTAFEGIGDSALKMFGQFSGSPTATTATSSAVTVTPGEEYSVSLAARVNSDDSIDGMTNSFNWEVEFFDASGSLIPGAIFSPTSPLFDGSMGVTENEWIRSSLTSLTAPNNAATAKVKLIFDQTDSGGGAVWVDDVLFLPSASASGILVTPEPGTMVLALLGLGMGCLAGVQRRRC